MIKTQRITSILSKIEDCEGFESVNVLIWKGKWKAFSPYYLKTDGNEINNNEGGIIFENFWQGSKVYDIVYDIKVYTHYTKQGNDDYLLWEYKTKEGNGQVIYDKEEDRINMKAYMRWRNSLWDCDKAIRYPNGRERRKYTQFALIIDKEGNQERLNYIQARKKLYVKEYKRLVRKLDEYEILLNKLKKGKNLLLCEIDVPSKGRKGKYGEVDEEGNCEMTLEKIKDLLNDESEPFGHGLALAQALLEDLNKN